ncbi:hypothetical protein GCM10009804_33720 [Kribbella hippodromi]|uniref:Uncharacterized protein n=1 Tax=Kribbella hippodromi TaxID=434347 RepID=A0ABN2DDW4_9ACTN
MSEHPGEQFPSEVDPDVEPGFDPYRSEEAPADPDYDTEPGSQSQSEGHAQSDSHGQAEGHGQAEAGERLDPAEVEFGPEFARAPGEEHEHSFETGAAEAQHEGSAEAQHEGGAAVAQHEGELADVQGEFGAPEAEQHDQRLHDDQQRQQDDELRRHDQHDVHEQHEQPQHDLHEQHEEPQHDEHDEHGESRHGQYEQGDVEQGEGGHPLVEETMARLEGLRERAVGEHAEVYADLHERLQSALVEADSEPGDRG